jgi:hypothetical protein
MPVVSIRAGPGGPALLDHRRRGDQSPLLRAAQDRDALRDLDLEPGVAVGEPSAPRGGRIVMAVVIALLAVTGRFRAAAPGVKGLLGTRS